jgi:hypothetical protein
VVESLLLTAQCELSQVGEAKGSKSGGFICELKTITLPFFCKHDVYKILYKYKENMKNLIF